MSRLTFDEKQFLLDGKPFTIISGTIHYFRVVPEYWEDRLKKLKACGFNTVETYTCWNLHERKEGQFNFSGILDLGKFIKTAQELGLYVILRPGPYICAEWEFGGLPSWLLKDPTIRLRCNDPRYLEKVRRYYKALLQEVSPYYAEKGGNLLAVQIENEYGSYGDDKDYLRAIADIYKENGVTSLLFTSDGPTWFMLGGGTLDEYLATANFGSKGKENFDFLRGFRPNQPAMCCEFWNGWFDHWYEAHHVREGDDTAKEFAGMLDDGGSVNFYMFHGGTNFGFWNGANCGDVYQPTVTSYDYDAPLSEAGDMTSKYYEVKAVIEQRFGKVPELDVKNNPKKAYGKISLTGMAPIFDNLDAFAAPVRAAYPMTMEELDQDFGFVLYSTTIDGPFEELPLHLDGVHDRAHIYVNGELRGIQERTKKRWDEVKLSLKPGESLKLDILVENMGRVNYGKHLLDRKGILGSVSLGQRMHFGWEMRSITCDDLSGLSYKSAQKATVPTFYQGSFTVEDCADTYLKLTGFEKGVAFINGFNLGRYWNIAGPQKTLYIPAPLLKKGNNELVVLELDGTSTLEVELTDTPDLG